MTTRKFYTLRVRETHHPITTAKSVVFDIPDALKDTFAWRAGQHITLRLQLNSEEIRRSYTISTAPDTGENLRITVKRVKNGRVSNYINDSLKAGDTVAVMPPFGRFCLDPEYKKRRTHYFFGAGSGITPLFAMIQSVLLAEPYSFAYLLYGNTDTDSIIFQKELATLTTQYPQRFRLYHVLSQQKRFSHFQPWRTGRIDADAVHAFIEACPPYAQDAQYYVCGPGTMNSAVKAALRDIDVPETRLHSETFGGTIEKDTSYEGTAANANVTLGPLAHQVQVEKGQTLLKAMLAADLNPPYSCQSGICGACTAKLIDGEVFMQARMALEDSDIKKGVILTCQALAKTDKITVAFA